MKTVTSDLPQVCEVVPGTPLAKFTIRRILRTNGSKSLNKIKTL